MNRLNRRVLPQTNDVVRAPLKLKQGSLGPRYAVVIWVSFYNKAAGACCNAITYKLWKLLELEPATSRITLPL